MTLNTAITKAETFTDNTAKINLMKRKFAILTKKEFNIFFVYFIEIGFKWKESITWAREEAINPLPKTKFISRR